MPDLAIPERSREQRMASLRRGNEIRLERAALKRDLKAGRAHLHLLLADPPEYLKTAKVFDLLLALPRYGRTRTNRVLLDARVSPNKTIGGLSDRQRAEIIRLIQVAPTVPTLFQKRVLRIAVATGSVAKTDVVADLLDTRPEPVVIARGALVRLGLVGEDGTVTAKGRAYLANGARTSR